MGYEYFKRPIRSRAGNSTFDDVTIADDLVVGDDLRVNGALRLPTETITTTTVAQTMSADGVSFITYGTSGKPSDVIIPVPPFAGAVKYVFVQNNTTSVELNLNTNATANTFWGTTFNTAVVSAASTGSPGGTPGGTVALTLIGASTTQWALVAGTTFNWDLSASTGSTATA